jgi:hypothetical protein
MRRCLPILLAPLALLAAAPPTVAGAPPPAHTKAQAEVNVLRVVARKWKARRLPGLVDPRTHLLEDNTEAVCRGRGPRRIGRRYSRFLCVVRPHVHSPRQGLYVGYVALPRGRFTIRWIAYRRR